jgi:hypothetical protein
MVKLYKANLSNSGFSKLNYYIEEEISLDFLGPLDKYTPIDGWVNGVLIEISRNTWSYEEPDIENLCNDIFPLLSKEEIKPAPFFKAIDYIKKHNLIQWAEKI